MTQHFYGAIVGSLNDLDELPGITSLVGEMLNRLGSSTYPEQEFTDIINSRLPQDVLDYAALPRTEEDKQLFYFRINANYLAPALEM